MNATVRHTAADSLYRLNRQELADIWHGLLRRADPAEKAQRAAELEKKLVAEQLNWKFPADPDDFSDILGVPSSKVSTTNDGTTRMIWEPNPNTRIRYESHPEGLTANDPGFNPRHHGEHYHIEVKPDGASWNQDKKKGLIQKVKP